MNLESFRQDLSSILELKPGHFGNYGRHDRKFSFFIFIFEMYTLYYWPGLPGRGEFVRLFLEYLEQPYRDVGLEGKADEIIELKQSRHGFAPPYLKDGEFIVSQVAAINLYLSKKHNIVSDDPQSQSKLMQALLTVSDVVSEIHDTHHPVSVMLPYEAQKEEAKVRSNAFLSERLPVWIKYFHNQLVKEWWVGDKLSAADLSLFQLLVGTNYAFPKAFEKNLTDRLREFIQRVEKMPAIARYLISDRRQLFNQNGIFRHYPELDISE